MSKPKLGIFSLTGCGGDQLQILNMEDELLDLVSRFDIVDFQEGSSRKVEGPIDIAFIEGTVSTQHDLEKLKIIRERSKILIAMGNCAIEGCIQSMRNGETTLQERLKDVYDVDESFFDARLSKPITEYIKVDFQIPGCPVEKEETLKGITSLLQGDSPPYYSYPVCVECKLNEYPCLITEEGKPCLGPVIRAGCDARCPGLGVDCIGCRGPVEGAENFAAEYEMLIGLGYTREDILKRLRVFSGEIGGEFLGGLDDE
ncbi:hydrogenase [Candidatus Bathyarchaeota archaeon]|nr:hydrogenase [Candidatus Bathyarchaeota archaeon]